MKGKDRGGGGGYGRGGGIWEGGGLHMSQGFFFTMNQRSRTNLRASDVCVCVGGGEVGGGTCSKDSTSTGAPPPTLGVGSDILFYFCKDRPVPRIPSPLGLLH